MTRPPHISPLFPYTSLSRSVWDDPFLGRPAAACPLLRPHAAEPAPLPDGELGAAEPLGHLGDGVEVLHLPAGDDDGEGRDRKSTRLNSSHDQISYAVFCLKK